MKKPYRFKKPFVLVLLIGTMLISSVAAAQKKNINNKTNTKKDSVKVESFGGLKFRSIGPAFTSGRIADIAVNPKKYSEWFVAVASGHLWKTVNAGITWEPVFDNYGAYSTSCVKYDPNNPFVLWLGTGENNHQRALGYGNGVYKSTDGGKTWKNMGLKESRQIGNILIDPRNSDVVYVACEGSVWGPGGDRGLYKTTDGGKTWKKILNISENTGVNNILCDPRNPDVLYASSEQRRRHVFTKIGGGPETAIYKSVNAGETWNKLTDGLPSKHIGGIGLAVSPVNPDIVYAIIESVKDASGFYRSANRGATWQKMSDHTAQGQYYNEIYCDPQQLDKIYSVETYSQVTLDGGKTWKNIGTKNRHVDDHALWIDPQDTQHFIIGGDGGLYETYDGGNEYRFVSNLPVMQLYRVQVDNSTPFYYVYGGTQDNNSVGGPSQNTSNCVVSDDWFITNGGDGFWSQIDPTDPNIVYAESQYGGMVRYDRKSGEFTEIRPEPAKDELSYKWNWDTPLLISPHNNKRLYAAANKIFRSDDRGDSWTAISDDLTAKIDRNSFHVMGKYWSFDAVQKDVSTSQYGTIISLEESTLKEGLIYAGTDDGVISITEDGGKNWRQVKKFPGVPEYTYVSDILASRFDENIVYASFDNILRDDFKPYVFKSTDKGKTWTGVSSNLPVNGTVHTIQQDHVNPDLLFIGTEFGVFFTNDGGKKWIQMKSGLPDIKVHDMAIQRRENDLVVATFGRGFYIIDDYSCLRNLAKDTAVAEATIFPVKDALEYIQQNNKSQMGATYYQAPNPPYGATFTYYLKKAPKTLKEIRQEKEDTLFKNSKPIPQPSLDQLLQEEREVPPYLTFTITDDAGTIIRKINTKPQFSVNRVSWDLRHTALGLVNTDKFSPGATPAGILALPGNYKVSLSITFRDTTKELVKPVPFKVAPLNNTTLPASDRNMVVEFYKKVSQLGRIMDGTINTINSARKEVSSIMEALQRSSKDTKNEMAMAKTIFSKLEELKFAFEGKNYGASEEENPPMKVTLWQRYGKISWATWVNTGNPTKEQNKTYDILMDEISKVYDQTKYIIETDLPALYKAIDAIGIPATPNRLPMWKK
ncbi:MAG: glycosyl hydrolase [Bacteroidia bacterium]|nr:glycosyl hydrolase [Bacteroidia bacterium]